MIKVYEKIRSNPLFDKINADDFETMLPCLKARVQSYEKGSIIQLAGDPVETVGLVVTGQVQIVREDETGKQSLLTELGEGAMFGEVFACAGVSHSPVTVLATKDSQVLHINYRKIIASCSSACLFHQRLIQNMLSLIAQKTLLLNQKIEILSKRTTRERLLFYFDLCRKNTRRFTLPYNREELAAYLSVDRSAMSAELSRMQRDGLIRYRKNEVELL